MIWGLAPSILYVEPPLLWVHPIIVGNPACIIPGDIRA